MLAGANSPWLEWYRRERALLARIERRVKLGQLLPRDEVHEVLARIATILRTAGEALGREFGPEATEIFNKALDDAQRDIDSCLDPVASGDDPKTDKPHVKKPNADDEW